MSSEFISVNAPGTKIATAWGLAGVAQAEPLQQAALVNHQVPTLLQSYGITSWSDAAGALAALYSVLLILEWFWKKFIKPWYMLRKGRLPTRRKYDR